MNARIVIAYATGILQRRNSNLLAVNSGHVVLTKEWARYVLKRMGYVKQKSHSKAKVTPTYFTQLQSNILVDIRAIVEMEEGPPVNWDFTRLKYVPVSAWTMAKEGLKQVDISGIDDKSQITTVFAVTLARWIILTNSIDLLWKIACLFVTHKICTRLAHYVFT